jgi:hypothetical protein
LEYVVKVASCCRSNGAIAQVRWVNDFDRTQPPKICHRMHA